MGQWGLGLTVGDGVLAPPHGLEEEKAGLEGAHPGGSPVAWGRQSGRRGQSRCVERPQRGPPAQPCRSVGGHWGLFGGEGAGLWGQSSVAVIFALRLCADNSIPAVVQLILMKYCHYCRIKLVCSRNSQAETLGGRSLFLFWGGGACTAGIPTVFSGKCGWSCCPGRQVPVGRLDQRSLNFQPDCTAD